MNAFAIARSALPVDVRYWVIKGTEGKLDRYYGGTIHTHGCARHMWLVSQGVAKRYRSKACAERRALRLSARVVCVVRRAKVAQALPLRRAA